MWHVTIHEFITMYHFITIECSSFKASNKFLFSDVLINGIRFTTLSDNRENAEEYWENKLDNNKLDERIVWIILGNSFLNEIIPVQFAKIE